MIHVSAFLRYCLKKEMLGDLLSCPKPSVYQDSCRLMSLQTSEFVRLSLVDIIYQFRSVPISKASLQTTMIYEAERFWVLQYTKSQQEQRVFGDSFLFALQCFENPTVQQQPAGLSKCPYPWYLHSWVKFVNLQIVVFWQKSCVNLFRHSWAQILFLSPY